MFVQALAAFCGVVVFALLSVLSFAAKDDPAISWSLAAASAISFLATAAAVIRSIL